MNKRNNACLLISDSNGIPYGKRLKKIREAAGISPHEAARLAGLTVPSYYDAELCEGELNTVLSLGELTRIASAFAIPTSQLFEDRKPKQKTITTDELVKRINNYLITGNILLEILEDRIGYEIKDSLVDPKLVLNWNVDCLRLVCNEIGVDWLSALPVSTSDS